jgi:hypothetical protein
VLGISIGASVAGIPVLGRTSPVASDDNGVGLVVDDPDRSHAEATRMNKVRNKNIFFMGKSPFCISMILLVRNKKRPHQQASLLLVKWRGFHSCKRELKTLH